uniref:Uncharacterized protein n=1 Tax=Cajanus cajan TaxID=3821 RepID=A0A151T7N9_CAJCA|nr:hypothetical protein KK1_017622 [Cajanus cajan]
MGSSSFTFILPLLLLTFSSMISDTSVAEARILPKSAKVHQVSKVDLPPLPTLPLPLPLPPLPSLPVPLPAVPLPDLPLPSVPLPNVPLPNLPIPNVPIPNVPIPKLKVNNVARIP